MKNNQICKGLYHLVIDDPVPHTEGLTQVSTLDQNSTYRFWVVVVVVLTYFSQEQLLGCSLLLLLRILSN